MKIISLFLVSIYFPAFANGEDAPGAIIAKEYLLDKQYGKAIESCKDVLEEQPGNRECQNIIKQAKEAMAQSKAKADAARKKERDRELAAQQKQDSKECRLSRVKLQICELNVSRANLEVANAHENQVGRESGYINAFQVRKNTQSLIHIRNEISAFQKELSSGGQSDDTSDAGCGLEKGSSGYFFLQPKKKQAMEDLIGKACG